MDAPPTITCSHCGKELSLCMVASLPKEQTLKITLTSDKSEMIAAKVLGDTITETTKALREVARTMGGKVEVFVKDVQVLPMSVSVTLSIASVS